MRSGTQAVQREGLETRVGTCLVSGGCDEPSSIFLLSFQASFSFSQQEHRFEKALGEKKGFVIKKMKEDGACLFRAVADQVYGDQDMHDVVRKHCMDYLMKNADYFSNYVTEDFTTYINRKRKNNCHGNHIEMQAMAEMYNRPVEVYQYGTEPINTFHGIHQNNDEPIRVSYHRNIHYNSVVNPNKATIGVGLGLPAFKPGYADQSLMKNAIKTSEESWIEQQMLEDKKRATDWEATNEAIEEQVARESYLQWLQDQEKQARQVPEKLLLSACHLMVSIATTVRPVFLVTVPAVQKVFNLVTDSSARGLPPEAQVLVCRALSNMLLLPWPNLPESEQQWHTRSTNHANLLAALTRHYRQLRGTANLQQRRLGLEDLKAVLQQALRVLRDVVDSISGESTKSRQVCYQSLQESVQVSLALFPVFIHQPDVTDEMLSFFLTLFQGLRVQMGVPFTEQIIQTFLNMFTRWWCRSPARPSSPSCPASSRSVWSRSTPSHPRGIAVLSRANGTSCLLGPSSQSCVGADRATPSPLVSLYPALEYRAIMQEMSPTAFGLTDWEDDEILASVLAVSQQEYLDSMKKNSMHREPSPDSS
ncbi:OTU5A protein, partial [Atractosteus spatula]|nr:OTU5A protein [Atractosteus spatula]